MPSSADGSSRIRWTTVRRVGASKGLWPVAAKATTEPSPNTSLAGPARSARIYSGDM